MILENTLEREESLRDCCAMPAKPSTSTKRLSRNSIRRVSFDQKPTVYRVLGMSDFTQEERENYWFSSRQYEVMKLATAMTVRAMVTSSSFRDTDACCARGLEYRTKDRYQQLQLNRIRGYQSVLKTQRKQRDEGTIDAEVIASAYGSVSARCAQAAYELGQSDWRDIQSYCKEVEKSQKGVRKNPRKDRRQMLRRMFSGKRKGNDPK